MRRLWPRCSRRSQEGHGETRTGDRFTGPTLSGGSDRTRMPRGWHRAPALGQSHQPFRKSDRGRARVIRSEGLEKVPQNRDAKVVPPQLRCFEGLGLLHNALKPTKVGLLLGRRQIMNGRGPPNSSTKLDHRMVSCRAASSCFWPSSASNSMSSVDAGCSIDGVSGLARVRKDHMAPYPNQALEN